MFINEAPQWRLNWSHGWHLNIDGRFTSSRNSQKQAGEGLWNFMIESIFDIAKVWFQFAFDHGQKAACDSHNCCVHLLWNFVHAFVSVFCRNETRPKNVAPSLANTQKRRIADSLVMHERGSSLGAFWETIRLWAADCHPFFTSFVWLTQGHFRFSGDAWNLQHLEGECNCQWW